jgi:hypothetical protein
MEKDLKPEAKDSTLILEESAELRKGKFGFSLAFNHTARLYPDRLEVVKSDGTLVASIPLAYIINIKRAMLGVGLIIWLTDGRSYRLDFFTFKYRFFGIVGMLVSKCGAKSNQWEGEILSAKSKIS